MSAAEYPDLSEVRFRDMPLPRRVRVPAPVGEPKAIGTVVKAGEMLTTSLEQGGVAALSPMRGTITNIVDVALLNGRCSRAIEVSSIEGFDANAASSSGQSSTVDAPSFQSESPASALESGTAPPPALNAAGILAGGVCAQRICSPDLGKQLNAAENNKIHTIVCCVLDTDPSLPLNEGMAVGFPAELAAGLETLARATSAVRVLVAVDATKPTGWEAIAKAKKKFDRIRAVAVRSDYPQADPSLLLYTLLDRKLSPGGLPTDVGVLLLDAAAAVAIGQLAMGVTANTRGPLAVHDHFRRQTHLLFVAEGTAVMDICRFLQVRTGNVSFRAGEFLRDIWVDNDAVVGGGCEQVIHVTAAHHGANPDPCIRCGWCVEACPTRINPAGLLQAAQLTDAKLAGQYGLGGCIECGICSYVCPTWLPLLPAIRGLKQALAHAPEAQ